MQDVLWAVAMTFLVAVEARRALWYPSSADCDT